jgi:hypothetical protein
LRIVQAKALAQLFDVPWQERAIVGIVCNGMRGKPRLFQLPGNEGPHFRMAQVVKVAIRHGFEFFIVEIRGHNGIECVQRFERVFQGGISPGNLVACRE